MSPQRDIRQYLLNRGHFLGSWGSASFALSFRDALELIESTASATRSLAVFGAETCTWERLQLEWHSELMPTLRMANEPPIDFNRRCLEQVRAFVARRRDESKEEFVVLGSPGRFKEQRGQFLGDDGHNDFALTRDRTTELLTRLECFAAPVAVLGGDLYRVGPSVPQPLHEGWSCDPRHAESAEDFARRTIVVAKDYLALPFVAQSDALVVLVCREE